MSDWSQARKILAVRLDAMGDVLMTTPALRALRESAPDRTITLWTSAAGAGIARLIPEVDKVRVYAAPWMKATLKSPGAQPDWNELRALRAEGFDAAVIFTVFSQSPLPAALACYLAGIPRRLAHCRENPYHLLTDWVPETEPEKSIRHETRRQLDLVQTVGCRTEDERLSLRPGTAARQRVLEALSGSGLNPNDPWILIHPGASAPSRRYPPEQYARAASLIARERRCRILFSGGAEELALVESIRAAMTAPSWSLAGRLNLEELAALIGQAPLLVANNTGPAHIAAAMGTPVVDLYALTNPQHQPWRVPNKVLFHDVPCKFCFKSVCPEGHHDCLRKVPPEAVAAAAGELMRSESYVYPGH